MQLKHLQSFAALAEALHFRRAAEALGITQPALSQHLSKLERDVGTRLVDRDKRTVRLTPAGGALLDGAREALDALDRAARAARRLGEAREKTLVVGQLDYISHAYLPAALHALQARFPDVTVETRDLSAERALAGVRDGSLDVGFALGPVQAPDLVLRPVLRGHWTVVLPGKHRLATQKAIPLRSLAGEPLVLFQRRINPQVYGAIMAHCERAGFTARVAHHVAQPQHGPAMVAQGVGLFLVGSYVLRELPEGLVSRPLVGFPAELTVFAAWRSGVQSDTRRAFLSGLARLPR